MHCGQAPDPEAANDIEAQDERAFNNAIQADVGMAETVETMREMLKENPRGSVNASLRWGVKIHADAIVHVNTLQ